MSHLKFVNKVWNSFKTESGLEPCLFKKMEILGAEKGTVVMKLFVEKNHTNRLQTFHGGAIASLVDLGGSLAVSSRGLFATGVSTDINATYIRSGGKVGDEVYMVSLCDKLGTTLAYTSVSFYDGQKKLFARGSHTKFVSNAYKDPRNNLEMTKPPSKEEEEQAKRLIKDFI